MTQARTPGRVVLKDVPYIGPDLHRMDPATGVRRCLEGATFPSTLRTCLEYADDTMGARFYTRFGFVQTGRYPVYYYSIKKQKEDAARDTN